MPDRVLVVIRFERISSAHVPMRASERPSSRFDIARFVFGLRWCVAISPMTR